MQTVHSVQKVALGSGKQMLSGLFAPAVGEQPKALIVAIHGGGYASSYFHLDAFPELSLLKLGSEMGYSVLSIDRPGYGIAEELYSSFDDQIPILKEALNQAIKEYGSGSAGVFLVGHSIGAMISILLAGDSIEDTLLGLDLSGAGIHFHAESKTGLSQAIEKGPLFMDEQTKKALFYGPDWTRSNNVIKEDMATFLIPAKEVEIKDAIFWEKRVLTEGPRVSVPIQFTLGEYENLWVSSEEVMKYATEVFSSAPFIDVRIQRFAGHCNHLHSVGRAYNLRTLAFVDECIAFQSAPKD